MSATFEREGTRSALLWLAALKILTLVVVFDPAGAVSFDLPKSLASRAIEWAIGAVLLVALLAHGRGILPRTRLHVAVAALAGTSIIASLVAAEPYIAIFGEQDRYLGLTNLGDMLLLYLAIAVAVRSAQDVTLLLGAIGLAGIVTGGYAVVQALGADPFNWAVDPRSRPFATFGNPDQLGHLMAVAFGVAFGALIAATRPRVRAIAGAGALAALGIAGVVATRGSLVGIGGAVAGALALRRPTRRSALAGGAAAVALAALLLITPLGQRAVVTVRGAEVADRITLYAIAARATLSRPLFGYGPDNFRAAFVTHRTAESLPILSSGPQTSAHDWLLDASATTGLIGLAALLLVVGLGTVELAGVARGRPDVGTPLFIGWSAYWANALVDVGSVGVGWFPWLALGVAAALRGSTRQGASARHLPRWLPAAVAVVAFAGIATGTRAFVANRESWAAAEAAHFGDTDAAVALADRAAARDGGRADYWNRLGLALESQRQWGDAAAAYRNAASRERFEPTYWTNLARALARVALAGQPASRADSLAAAREAVAVDPNSPAGHLALAEIATAFGSCDLARSEAAVAATLQPGHDDVVTRAAACR